MGQDILRPSRWNADGGISKWCRSRQDLILASFIFQEVWSSDGPLDNQTLGAQTPGPCDVWHWFYKTSTLYSF